MRKLVMTTISVVALVLLSSIAYSQPCTAAGSILSVKNTTIGNFDFAVFTLKKPLNTGYSYTVTTETGPFTEDPSGNPVPVTGPKFKQIKFQGIEWMCVIGETLTTPTTAIKDIKKIEQHEGYVTYIVGHRNASPFIAHYTYPVFGNTQQKVVMMFRRF